MVTTSGRFRAWGAGRRGIFVATAGTLGVSGALLVAFGLTGTAGPPQPPAATPSAAVVARPEPTATPTPGPTTTVPPEVPAADLGPVLAASEPVAVDIPSIGVHATSLAPLSVDADGTLPAPTDYDQAGWYTGVRRRASSAPRSSPATSTAPTARRSSTGSESSPPVRR